MNSQSKLLQNKLDKSQSDKSVDSIKVFNVDRIKSVCFGDIELEKELLELAIEDVNRRLPDLLQAKSYEAWCYAVHAIKGCSSSVGGDQLANVAFLAEQDPSKDSESEKWNEKLIQAAGEFQTAVHDHLDTLQQ